MMTIDEYISFWGDGHLRTYDREAVASLRISPDAKNFLISAGLTSNVHSLVSLTVTATDLPLITEYNRNAHRLKADYQNLRLLGIKPSLESYPDRLIGLQDDLSGSVYSIREYLDGDITVSFVNSNVLCYAEFITAFQKWENFFYNGGGYQDNIVEIGRQLQSELQACDPAACLFEYEDIETEWAELISHIAATGSDA